MKKISMTRVDAIDRWSLYAMAVMAGWFVLLVSMHDILPPRTASYQAVAAQQASPEFAVRLKTAENLLSAGNMMKLKNLLAGMIKDYPYQAEPFMLLADHYIRIQKPIEAMHAFRQALDLNMDYLEKKTDMYQGKKIMNIVREAQEQINNALAADPGDSVMQENRKEVYYMLRKLAGGCSD